MYKRKASESQNSRVLRILAALAKVPQASVKELSDVTQIPLSTVYRILDDSISSGLVRKTSSAHYGAGPVSVQLAERYRDTSGLHGTVTPYLRELSRQTGELTAFMVVHGAEAVCVESVESERALRCSYTVGKSQPLIYGATARALLSRISPADRRDIFEHHAIPRDEQLELEQKCSIARADGFAVSTAELDEGIWGVSAAVTNSKGMLKGAVTLMAPAQRIDQRGKELIELTCRTAIALSGGNK
ncbi:IclR family transcriptional regulator [Glutamicibacter sp.]|uniref:IclR family transcriptional regulator n=1 Tax=Glutamicibacter sp. TaxID=1931995 RepID=UPI0028BDECE1|nr:IclR family transcriptional regulator [Glutamicibacter sp.]